MALKIFAKTKSGLKRIFGLSEITGNYGAIKDMAKGFYDYNTHKVGQTGNERTVYLPKTFLSKREKDFKNLFILFLMILALGMLYFLYAVLHQLWTEALLVLCFCMFISALCFRYHFWWMQVKKRKLGCTFDEWKAEALSEIKGRAKK